jgi:hypothetical protein
LLLVFKCSSTVLDLDDIAYGANTTATYSGTTTSGVLTVTDGTHTAKINLAGNFTTAGFSLSKDAQGGTAVAGTPTKTADHFIAAMAAMGAGGAMTPSADLWTPQVHVLASPA